MVTVPGRQLRVELRRSTAPVAGAAAAALLVLLLGVRRDEWANGWTGLALTSRNDLTVLVPLALAAGCWQGGRERRARTEELVASTSRPVGQRVLTPAAAVAVAVCVALAGVLLAAAVLGGPGSWLGQPWPLAVVAVGVLSAVAAVFVGVGLGRWLRSNLVAPLALIVLFVLVLAFTATYYVDSWSRLLAPALEGSGDDARQVRPAVSAGQVMWFTGLLLAGAVLAVAARWRTRVLAVLPALAGFALAVPLLSAADGAAFADDPVAARLVCASGRPAVCVTAVHQAALLTVTDPARDVLARLQQLPDAPTRAVEQTGVPADRAAGGPADVLPIQLPQGRPDQEFLRQDLADGLGVRPCLASPGGPENAFDARMVAGAWLLGTPVVQAGRPAEQILARLRRLPEEEQRRRMTVLRAALRACDRDPLGLLP